MQESGFQDMMKEIGTSSSQECVGETGLRMTKWDMKLMSHAGVTKTVMVIVERKKTFVRF